MVDVDTLIVKFAYESSAGNVVLSVESEAQLEKDQIEYILLASEFREVVFKKPLKIRFGTELVYFDALCASSLSNLGYFHEPKRL